MALSMPMCLRRKHACLQLCPAMTALALHMHFRSPVSMWRATNTWHCPPSDGPQSSQHAGMLRRGTTAARIDISLQADRCLHARQQRQLMDCACECSMSTEGLHTVANALAHCIVLHSGGRRTFGPRPVLPHHGSRQTVTRGPACVDMQAHIYQAATMLCRGARSAPAPSHAACMQSCMRGCCSLAGELHSCSHRQQECTK